MAKKLGEWAMGAANTATQGLVGGAMGLMFAKSNDRRQIRQEEKLQRMQIEGSKELTDYNMRKQLEMWNATGYEAQIAQMKAAGLNPALMYGMGGGGGQSANVNSGSVGRGSAPVGGGEAQAGMGMGIQAGLAAAQMKVMESQANLNNVEANKKAGVDTELGRTQIESLTQGIQNSKAVEQLTKADTYLKVIAGAIEGATVDAKIEQIEWNAEMAGKQVELARQEVFIGKETMQSKIEIIQKEAIAAGLRNILTGAQTEATKAGTELTKAQTGKVAVDIKVSEQQIKKWAQEITMGWTGLDQKDQELRIKTFAEEFKANHPGVLQVGGKVLDKFIENIMDLSPRNNWKDRKVGN